MRDSSRREFVAAVAAGAILSAASEKVAAQIPVTDAGSIFQELLGYIKQGLQYAKQLDEYATQLQQFQLQVSQYTTEIYNTLAIPQEIWSTVQSDIMQVQQLANATSLLSGNSGSAISRLQSLNAYANRAASLGNMAGQFSGYQRTLGNSLSTMGQTLGIQQGMQTNNVALLGALQQHSQNAVGQMQAIQAGNELAHATATQLIQIQATLSATAQMQATQMAVDADRRASEDAELQRFNAGAMVIPTPGQTW